MCFGNSSEISSFANQFQQTENAQVAELVDALDSKSSFRKEVGVRFPPRVLKGSDNPLIVRLFKYLR